jgi:AcrR family transcriptional regulator
MNRPTVTPNSKDVKSTRRYHAPRRAEQAARTRRSILDAARELFTVHGYAATSIAEIAQHAGVAIDTIYATIGRKPALMRELVESAISGTDYPVPAEERDYVQRTIAAATAREKFVTYAEGIVAIHQRLAPTFLALHDAAVNDSDCAALRKQINERRATNMRRFAADLRSTGEIRADLTDDQVADIIWTMNAAEYFDLLHQRGWTSERIGSWLADAWARLLLA